jgi:hypothetical protein
MAKCTDMKKVGELTDALRVLGCAVCVFVPEDVISGHLGDVPVTAKRYASAAAWLLDNEKALEEHMSGEGNFFIAESAERMVA